MANENQTDISILLDRSGSMNERKKEVIGGYNQFLKTQRETSGECYVTLTQFDAGDKLEIDTVYTAINVKEAQDLNDDAYIPRGMTPLLDAIGITITKTGARLAAIPEQQRPGKVIFMIVTDGLENASREYKKAKISEMVKHQEEAFKWDFIFIGANIDAIAEGKSMNMTMANTITVHASNIGATMSASGQHVKSYRNSGAKSDLGYTVTEREELAKDTSTTTGTGSTTSK